jgi:hypothetical protein
MLLHKHPFQTLSFTLTSIVLIVLLAITLLFFIRMQKMSTPLSMPGIVPNGILSFEFATTAKKAQFIANTWREANLLAQAIKLQWINFLFMTFYSTTFGLACIWSTQLMPIFDSWWLELGVILAWLQWVAALFDATENLCLFPFLYDTYKDGIPLALIAAVSAAIKFGLIILGLLYFLISIGIKLFLLVQKQ